MDQRDDPADLNDRNTSDKGSTKNRNKTGVTASDTVNRNDSVIEDSTTKKRNDQDPANKVKLDETATVEGSMKNGNVQDLMVLDTVNRNENETDDLAMQNGNASDPLTVNTGSRNKSINTSDHLENEKNQEETEANMVNNHKTDLVINNNSDDHGDTNGDSDDNTIVYFSEAEKDIDEKSGYSSGDSILYGFKRVNRKCKKIWIQKAKQAKVSVNLLRLSRDKIAQYTKNQAHTWDDIDPYSDVEVVNSESDTNTADPVESKVLNKVTGYTMRPQKSTKTTDKAARKSGRKCVTKPTEAWYDNLDLPPSPKRKRKEYVGLKGPSSACIRSRNIQKTAPEQTIPIEYLSKELSEPEPDPPTDEVVLHKAGPKGIEHRDADTSSKAGPSNEMEHKRMPKGKFSNTTHGILKHKWIRSYKCPVCNVCKPSQAEANEHYKNNHPPVKCTQCPKVCSTSCTLARHMSLHSDLKYLCHRCEQRFVFESELKVHKFKHRRIRMFKCAHADCHKTYFSEGELNQHAKVHDNIDHKCNHDGCKYSTPDVRLLRSHERTHKDFLRFYCCICQIGFKYHTQWKQHVIGMQCTVPPLQP